MVDVVVFSLWVGDIVVDGLNWCQKSLYIRFVLLVAGCLKFRSKLVFVVVGMNESLDEGTSDDEVWLHMSVHIKMVVVVVVL